MGAFPFGSGFCGSAVEPRSQSLMGLSIPNAVGEVITFRWSPRPFAFAPKVRTHVRRFYHAVGDAVGVAADLVGVGG